MNVPAFSLRHERAIVFVVGALVALGIWAYTQSRAEIFPEMRFSRIDVVAQSGDLPPEEMRVAVGLPLEKAFMGLPFVRRVVTTTEQGSAEFVVQFDPRTDAAADLQLVNAALSNTRAELPPQTRLDAEIIYPQTEPILSYVFTSPLFSQTLLDEYARLHVVPELYGAPGLWRVFLMGAPPREYHVALDPAALAQARLTPSDVAHAIGAANDIEAAGISQQYGQRRAVLVESGIHTSRDLERVVIPESDGSGLPLGALGAVTLGTAPATDDMAYDGTHGVAMSVYELPGANTVMLARDVKARLRDATLPQGITLHKYWDATKLIVASQESLRDAILLGRAPGHRRHLPVPARSAHDGGCGRRHPGGDVDRRPLLVSLRRIAEHHESRRPRGRGRTDHRRRDRRRRGHRPRLSERAGDTAARGGDRCHGTARRGR